MVESFNPEDLKSMRITAVGDKPPGERKTLNSVFQAIGASYKKLHPSVRTALGLGATLAISVMLNHAVVNKVNADIASAFSSSNGTVQAVTDIGEKTPLPEKIFELMDGLTTRMQEDAERKLDTDSCNSFLAASKQFTSRPLNESDAVSRKISTNSLRDFADANVKISLKASRGLS